MNRRNFLAGLLALPAVVLAACDVKPLTRNVANGIQTIEVGRYELPGMTLEDWEDREAVKTLNRSGWMTPEAARRELALTAVTASNYFYITGTPTITGLSLFPAANRYTLSVAGEPGYVLYAAEDQPFTHIRVR